MSTAERLIFRILKNAIKYEEIISSHNYHSATKVTLFSLSVISREDKFCLLFFFFARKFSTVQKLFGGNSIGTLNQTATSRDWKYQKDYNRIKVAFPYLRCDL